MQKGMRLAPSAALLERRLAERLASGTLTVQALEAAEATAWARGVGELLGSDGSGLVAALEVARVGDGTSVEAIHEAACALGLKGLRTTAKEGAAPPELIIARLDDLAAWLASPGLAEVGLLSRAALAFARIHDIAPTGIGDEPLAHVALARVLRAHGHRLPLFEPADAAPLQAAREAALTFDFAPLVAILEDACGRMLAWATRFEG